MRDDNKFIVDDSNTKSSNNMGINEEYNSANGSDFVIIDSDNNYQYQQQPAQQSFFEKFNAKILVIIGLILLLLLFGWILISGYLKNKAYDDWLNKIRLAAKQHVDTDDKVREAIEDSNKENIYIFELTEGNHLSTSDLVNPKTGKTINKCNYVGTSIDLNNEITYPEVNLLNTTCPSLKPVIDLKGDVEMTLEQGTAYVEPGATATDYDGTDLTKKIKITGTVDVNTPGKYQVSYNVKNTKGKKATEVVRVVIITAKEVVAPVPTPTPVKPTPARDTTKPWIRATGLPATINQGQTLNYSLAFGDNSRIRSITYCSNTCQTEQVYAASRTKYLSFYGGSAGTFKISASVVDTSGNTAYYESYVGVNTIVVADTIAPTIYWENPSASFTVGTAVSFRIVYTDNVAVKNYHISIDRDGTVGDALIKSESVTPAQKVIKVIPGSFTKTGTYTITASASDTSGNFSGNKVIGRFRVY